MTRSRKRPPRHAGFALILVQVLGGLPFWTNVFKVEKQHAVHIPVASTGCRPTHVRARRPGNARIIRVYHRGEPRKSVFGRAGPQGWQFPIGTSVYMSRRNCMTGPVYTWRPFVNQKAMLTKMQPTNKPLLQFIEMASTGRVRGQL